jgi:hypothetical protein
MSEKNESTHSKISALPGQNLPKTGETSRRATVQEKFADATLRFVEQYGHSVQPMTHDEEKKLNMKLYIHVLLLLCTINLMLFVSLFYFLEKQETILTTFRLINLHSHSLLF